jgi:SAM-dependent MidA family methyltransferase
VLTPGDSFRVAAAQLRSAELSALIRARAEARGGWLPFSEYMEAALYEPGLGYYMTGSPIFGATGDFITAPELSPLFSACLARGVGKILEAAGGGDIVEFGAGSGRMAEELFGELASRGVPPARYRIVEPSAELAERQHLRVSRSTRTAGYVDRFEWLKSPPTSSWQGVALANEVLDALPCDRFRIAKGRCEAIGVVPATGGFEWAARPADAVLAPAIEALQSKLPEPMPPGFVSELRLRQGTWLAAATAGLAQGVMLVIDYGLPRAQYYHASRDGGTLCGFRQHLRVDDPLALPGAQDLTAWVDFSAVADEARDAGLAVRGFSTQAHYLLSTGIEQELERLAAGMTGIECATLRQGAATLLLPGEMGERFKVIALARGIRGPFHGFEFRDLSASL